MPAVLYNKVFLEKAKAAGRAVPFHIALERDNGLVSTYEIYIFPVLAEKITLYIPDEYERRVGQSIVAASLPKID